MKKPRVIIADADYNYVLTLLNRLIREFFDSAELEVITDKTYFQNLFSAPQDVDILIVSDSLFSSLTKHNYVKYTFVLSEKNGQEFCDDNSVILIPKYASIKEVFARITGKCSEVLQGHSTQKSKSKIIAVFSGAGGVGKTTISLGVSAYLNNILKRVLYINAAQIQSILGEISRGDYNVAKSAIKNNGFSYLMPFRSSLMSFGLDFSFYRNFITIARNSSEYDLILIDMEIGLDAEKIKILDIADKVLIITKPDAATVFATNQLADSISGSLTDKYIYICNDTNDMTEASSTHLSNNNQRYLISSYVHHFSSKEKTSVEDLAMEKDIQRIAHFLI